MHLGLGGLGSRLGCGKEGLGVRVNLRLRVGVRRIRVGVEGWGVRVRVGIGVKWIRVKFGIGVKRITV